MFPRRRINSAARYGTSQEASQNGLFYALFGGGKTNAGAYVTEHTAINFPVVYACISIIADALAMLPVDVYQKNKNTGRGDPVSGHKVSEILNVRPNPFMSALTCRQTLNYHMLGWGNSYCEIELDGAGAAQGMWPLLPDATRPKKNADGTGLIFSTRINGKEFNIEDDRVCHVPALGYDGYVGYSPINVARQAIGLGLAMEEFGAKFFANDAKSGGFLQHPGKLSDNAQKNIAESMQQQGGLDNAHRIKVLEEGMKWVSTTIAPEDAQFLGSRGFQISEIARIYRVPLPLLNSLENTTAWGSGIEQMIIGFIVWTLQPWGSKIEQEYNQKLFTKKERESGLYLRLNYRALMRGDMAARKEFYKAGIVDGWMTRNEVREKEDMPPLPGLDEPLQPLNMTTAQDGGQNNAAVQPDS